MKKLVLSGLALVVLGFNSTAQFEISNLYAGAELGFAKPVGKFSKYAAGGLSYTAFAGYNFTENISGGVEYQGAITAGIQDDITEGVLGVSFYGLESILINGTYMLNDEETVFRPYATLGLGLGMVTEPTFSDSDGEVIYKGKKGIGLGAKLGLGISLSGFRIGYNFNYSGNTPTDGLASEGNLPVLYHNFVLGYMYNF